MTQKEFEVFIKGDDKEDWWNLRVFQATPLVYTRKAKVKIINPESTEFEDLNDSLNDELKYHFLHRSTDHLNIYVEEKVNTSFSAIDGVLQTLAPYLEDRHFFIRQDEIEWLGEYKIVNGKLLVYDHEVKDTSDFSIKYFEHRALKQKDEEVKKLAAKLLIEKAIFMKAGKEKELINNCINRALRLDPEAKKLYNDSLGH